MEDRDSVPSTDDLQALEEHLAGTLKHVAPPNELVQRLRERIRFPARSDIVLRFQDWRRLFLVFGGVMSALLVLLTVARALFHLVGRRQM
jgi:hypothetical protein